MIVKNGKAGFVNKFGKIVIPIIYDENKVGLPDYQPDGTLDFRDGGFARVELNHKYGYLNKTGKKLTEIKYDYADELFDGFGLVKMGHLYSAVDTNGTELFDYVTYDSLYKSEENYRKFKNYFNHHNQKGPYDTIQFNISKYDDVRPYRDGFYRIKKDGKIGFIDYTGYEYFRE